jgi:hypothetical protein
MNAIRKRDGFLMRLQDKVYDLYGYAYTWDEVELVINGKPQSELVSDVDYEALRNQAAIAAMQGVTNFFGSIDYNRETIAKLAVEQADALIEELKKSDT